MKVKMTDQMTMEQELKNYKDSVWKLINPAIAADPKTLEIYLATKLNNEAGELLGVRDYLLGEEGLDELGDNFWYIINFISSGYEDLVTWTSQYFTNGHSNINSHLDSYVVATAELSGLILKKNYHGKNISRETIGVQINKVLGLFLVLIEHRDEQPEGFVGDWRNPLIEIMKSNLNKLSGRHSGGTFNKDFYQGESS